MGMTILEMCSECLDQLPGLAGSGHIQKKRRKRLAEVSASKRIQKDTNTRRSQLNGQLVAHIAPIPDFGFLHHRTNSTCIGSILSNCVFDVMCFLCHCRQAEIAKNLADMPNKIAAYRVRRNVLHLKWMCAFSFHRMFVGTWPRTCMVVYAATS